MPETVSTDFVRQVRSALRVLAGGGFVGGSSQSPFDELATISQAFLFAPKGTNQSSNIADNDHVEWDDAGGVVAFVNSNPNLITVSGGAGQAEGLITLQPGHRWFLEMRLAFFFSAGNGQGSFRWFDNETSAFIGHNGTTKGTTNVANQGSTAYASAILDLTAAGALAHQVESRFVGMSQVTSLSAGDVFGSMMMIRTI